MAKSHERLCIFIDLMIIFGRPILFSNLFEGSENLCCFHEVLRHRDMTVVERIEILNLEEKVVTVKKGNL